MDFDHSTDSITPDVTNTLNLVGNVSVSGNIIKSVTASITPAGTTQGTATPITSSTSVVPAAFATANAGIILPTPVIGMELTVINGGTVAVNVYPSTSTSIAGLANNIPVTIGTYSVITFIANTASAWVLTQKSFINSSPITVSVTSPSNPSLNDLWLSI